MKTFTFKNGLQLLALFGVLIFASCNNNNEELELDKALELSAEEVAREVLSDDVSEEVSTILDTDELDFNVAGKQTPGGGKGKGRSSVASCATRTSEDTDTGKIVTLDFGDGCENRRGKVLAGKIVITYVKNDDGFSKSVAFDGFSVDGNAVTGSKSIEKVKQNTNGNPQATKTVDITITFTTGEVVSKKGTKIKEKIAGADTDTRGDDVYEITGSWESVNKEGVTKKSTITTALLREYSCRYVVSGELEIVKDGETYTVDFGDGTCNNTATVTKQDGTTEEINLRRK